MSNPERVSQPQPTIRIEVRFTTGEGEPKSAKMTLGFLADYIAKIYGAGGFLTSVVALPP
jgi:hypothetical protein